MALLVFSIEKDESFHFLILGTGPIKCFECNSWEDPRCHDPFNYTIYDRDMPNKTECKGCCVKMVQFIGTGNSTFLYTWKSQGKHLFSCLEKGPLFQAQICNFTICLHMSERPIVNSSLVLYCVSEHYQVKRTCTDEFDVNFFMVNHACMTEGHRHGHMCFCEEDECNAANPTKLKPISFFSAFSASLLLLLCVQSWWT